MENGAKDLTVEELQRMISELENTYADLLADDSSVNTLSRIWQEIQLLQAELRARSN